MTTLDKWLDFRTLESARQAVAALQWNIKDCGNLLEACGNAPHVFHSEHGLLVSSELQARKHEAQANLEAAQTRLAEMSESEQ